MAARPRCSYPITVPRKAQVPPDRRALRRFRLRGWEVDTGAENCYTACIPINFGVCDKLEVDYGPDPYCCRFQL